MQKIIYFKVRKANNLCTNFTAQTSWWWLEGLTPALPCDHGIFKLKLWAISFYHMKSMCKVMKWLSNKFQRRNAVVKNKKKRRTFLNMWKRKRLASFTCACRECQINSPSLKTISSHLQNYPKILWFFLLLPLLVQ